MTGTAYPLTRQDLFDFGAELSRQISSNVVGLMREELDAKLAALSARLTAELKAHTEETLAASASEIMQVMATIVEPMQEQVGGHEKRLTKLESQTA